MQAQINAIIPSEVIQVGDKSYIVLKSQRLGSGGYATVYMGYEEKERRICAVKCIKINQQTGYQRERILSAMRLIKQLSQRNIVQIYDYLETQNDEIYIFMEYCNQGDLKQYLMKKGGYLTEKEVKNIILQLIPAFQELTKNSIANRDIKPANILLHKNSDKQICIKLADFDFAKVLTEIRPEQVQTDDAFNTIQGTAIYMAPEQYSHAGIKSTAMYDTRCDVFSFGITIFHLLFGTNRHPFFPETYKQSNFMYSPLYVYIPRINEKIIEVEKNKNKPNYEVFTFPDSPQQISSELLKDLLRRMINPVSDLRIGWNEFFLHQYFTDAQQEMHIMQIVDDPKDILKQQYMILRDYVTDHHVLQGIISISKIIPKQSNEQNQQKLFKLFQFQQKSQREEEFLDYKKYLQEKSNVMLKEKISENDLYIKVQDIQNFNMHYRTMAMFYIQTAVYLLKEQYKQQQMETQDQCILNRVKLSPDEFCTFAINLLLQAQIHLQRVSEIISKQRWMEKIEVQDNINKFYRFTSQCRDDCDIIQQDLNVIESVLTIYKEKEVTKKDIPQLNSNENDRSKKDKIMFNQNVAVKKIIERHQADFLTLGFSQLRLIRFLQISLNPELIEEPLEVPLFSKFKNQQIQNDKNTVIRYADFCTSYLKVNSSVNAIQQIVIRCDYQSLQ